MKPPRCYDLGIVRLTDLKDALGEPIRDQHMPDRETARVVFVDEVPDANWAHPCQYRIMDGDRLLVTLSRSAPPHGSFPMTEIYLSEKELWNPRFVEWCRSMSARPSFFTRKRIDDDVVRIDKMPWTIVYSQWITACWREWATALGHKRRDGWDAGADVSGHVDHQGSDRETTTPRRRSTGVVLVRAPSNDQLHPDHVHARTGEERVTRAATNDDFARKMRRKRGEPEPPAVVAEVEGVTTYYGVDYAMVNRKAAKLMSFGMPIGFYGTISMKVPGKSVIIIDDWLDKNAQWEHQRKERRAERRREVKRPFETVLIAASIARSIIG